MLSTAIAAWRTNVEEWLASLTPNDAHLHQQRCDLYHDCVEWHFLEWLLEYKKLKDFVSRFTTVEPEESSDTETSLPPLQRRKRRAQYSDNEVDAIAKENQVAISLLVQKRRLGSRQILLHANSTAGSSASNP